MSKLKELRKHSHHFTDNGNTIEINFNPHPSDPAPHFTFRIRTADRKFESFFITNERAIKDGEEEQHIIALSRAFAMDYEKAMKERVKHENK